MNTMIYKGYAASIQYSDDDECFIELQRRLVGKVLTSGFQKRYHTLPLFKSKEALFIGYRLFSHSQSASLSSIKPHAGE